MRFGRSGTAAVFLSALTATAGQAYAGAAEPLGRPATAARSPAKSVLLAAARSGQRVVAVGERGIILLSDDAGLTWRQAAVPVSVTLTAVQFPTPKRGWAVGHYGVVLHTEDGGQTWIRQLDGNAAAQLFLEAARSKAAQPASEDPARQRLLSEAERMVRDGPDKPFFDLYFEDEKRGFVVGAYNLMFRTEDGGKTWRSWSDRLDNPETSHIYAIKAAGKTLYLAGERGLVLVSRDGGASFARVETPYKGSYFAAAVFPDAVVVAGLRGNAHRSSDGGTTWHKIEVPAPISFNVATLLDDRSLLLANQAGQLFLSRDQGRTLQRVATLPLPPLAGVVGLADGALLTVGVQGVARVPMSVPPPAKSAQK